MTKCEARVPSPPPGLKSLLKCFNKSSPVLTSRTLLAVRTGAPEKVRLLLEEQSRLKTIGLHEKRAGSVSGSLVAGTDEAGRGPLAGPLVAGAVVFRENPMLAGLTDSKKLSPQDREELERHIIEMALCWSIGIVTVQELESMNPHVGSLTAMRRAVEGLAQRPDFLLVDGRFTVPALAIPQEALIKGDGLSYSLSAASILAKVARDRIMDDLDREYPRYGFSRHKGYGTEEHLEALRELGPCPHHRRSFAPVRECRMVQLTLWD